MSRSTLYAAVLVLAVACGDDDDGPGPGGGDGGGSAACGPIGESVACTGPGGCEGGQTCRQDGSYDECDCSTTAPDCAPEGTVAICLGAGGCVGRQTCSDGSFGSCECEDMSAGAVTALEITAPEAGAEVAGGLEITGTANGDVASVRVAIGDGPFLNAQGTESWSLSFNASELPDGLTEIVVQAIGGDGSEVRRWIQVRVQNVDPLVGTWFRTDYLEDYNPYCLVSIEANGAIDTGRCNEGAFLFKIWWRREGGNRLVLKGISDGQNVVATLSEDSDVLTISYDSRSDSERFERVVGDPPDEPDAGL